MSDAGAAAGGSGKSFREFLGGGGAEVLETEDVLAAVLPLFRQVAAWHEEGRVSPLRAGVAQLRMGEDAVLRCTGEAGDGELNLGRVEALQQAEASALEVIERVRLTVDGGAAPAVESLEIGERGGELRRPVYLAGYAAWEQEAGHHDGLTDIFHLGQVLASLALRLDFGRREDLAIFVAARGNLLAVRDGMNPVVAAVVAEMTELDRRRRAADLPSVIRRLENYREPGVVLGGDVTRQPEFAELGKAGRRRFVQGHLRDRLFELTRRNRLLYFKPSQASVNLTVASVPVVVNLAAVRLEHLFLWRGEVAEEVVAGKPMNLGRWLRFEDQPYLPGALDKLIADARRDRAEYGFAQLRLAVVFLHWHNLKEAAEERITSPLLLLPVELSRRRGVRDQYLLDPTSSEAEVNPVLRHYLRQLYGLELPERVDLREKAVEEVHRELEAQIRASEPGVELRFVDRPEIQRITERARQRVAQHQRRGVRRGEESAAKRKIEHSYDRDDFRPLGLQLFREKVAPVRLPGGGGAAGGEAKRFASSPERTAGERERELFAIAGGAGAGEGGNPYRWDFDLCSVTVGNFNYRKMSLVRDYGEMLEGDEGSEAFDRVFSIEEKKFGEGSAPDLGWGEQWSVAAGDATQRSAVALGRTGVSYIIQGPPGTGKSQTITNLIADYVARGKRVLFVCEKRAAIDVVFHRLRQRGLDELCCLIHDSQTDKKAFVLNLKETYEKWLGMEDGVDGARGRRSALVGRLEEDGAAMARFDGLMQGTPEHLGVPVRELLRRLSELRGESVEFSLEDAERFPTYSEWRRHAGTVGRMVSTLKAVAGVGTLAEHAFRWLGAGVIRAERPMESLESLSVQVGRLALEVEGALAECGFGDGPWRTLDGVEALTAEAGRLGELAERGQLALLDAGSGRSRALEESARRLGELKAEWDGARGKTVNWREKLAPREVESALELAKSVEGSVFRFFQPRWWRLKRAMERAYDFEKHAIRPGYADVLIELGAEQRAELAFAEARRKAVEDFGEEPGDLMVRVAGLRRAAESSAVAGELRRVVLMGDGGSRAVSRLIGLGGSVRELRLAAGRLLEGRGGVELAAIRLAAGELREARRALPELLPMLTEWVEAPGSVQELVRWKAWTTDQMEAAVAREGLERIYREERWLPRFDGRVLGQVAGRVRDGERDWMAANAELVLAEARARFRENVRISSLPVVQLSAEQRALKKSYGPGRRDLEHEFGKTMRYKSIRDLAAGDPGRVVRDLKPVWLMSPLSVSDTLPLAADLFDVVIFDEASQIPVEEAAPALFRAPQVIVVGDEMQMPPTKFFAAGRDGGEEEYEVEEGGERYAVALDADSFLTQSGRNLRSTLLAWHYRSRSESLIGFSNAAFYGAGLYTIPDRRLPGEAQAEIVVSAAADAVTNVEALFDRPLSFHRMERSPYVGRRNGGEAGYIAALLREMLRRKSGRSVGVVAFSEAQQGEIESALDALAAEDPEFGAMLEEEYTREEADQFVGLFVKNLENVQGDERDIIVLSICYGPDERGRMLMNFGPINQRGGEKRLNVIFSRARHHMAVVSSIQHGAIRNDYNEGAAALKRFLQYAESASRGDMRTARAVLEGMNPLARRHLGVDGGGERDSVVSQLGAALRARGHRVDENVGQSRFRCDLAIRCTAGAEYRLGLLVDTAAYYGECGVGERCVTRPGILEAFGWRVMLVLTRDWYHEPEAVLDRIERMLSGEGG